jgi:hypothetical protein
LLNPEMSGAWLRTVVGAYPSEADRRLKASMSGTNGPLGLGPLCPIACMIYRPQSRRLSGARGEATDYAEQVLKERIKSFCIAKPIQKLGWTERRVRRERLWNFQAGARGSKLGVGLETGHRLPPGAREIVGGGACLCRKPTESG